MGARGGPFYPLLYPVLFAASLVLGIAATNAGQYRPSDLAVVLTAVTLVSVLAVAAAYALVRLLDRADRAVPLAAALAMLAVAWCFYYLPARNALAAVSPSVSRHSVLVPVGVLATIAAAAW